MPTPIEAEIISAYELGYLGNDQGLALQRAQRLAANAAYPEKLVAMLEKMQSSGQIDESGYKAIRMAADPSFGLVDKLDQAQSARKAAGAQLVEETLPFTMEGKGAQDYPAMTELAAQLNEGQDVSPLAMVRGFGTDIVTRPLRGAREALFGVPMEQYQTQGSNLASTIGLNMMVDPTLLVAGPIAKGAKALAALAKGAGPIRTAATAGALAGLGEASFDASLRDVRGMEGAGIGDFAFGALVPAGISALGPSVRALRGARQTQMAEAQKAFAAQQAKVAGQAPQVPDIATPEMSPSQFAKASKAEDVGAFEGALPPSITPREAEKLPMPVVRWLGQATPDDYAFMDEARKAWKKNKVGGESGFSWLAETKGKEAFDIFEGKMNRTGNAIQSIRENIVPQLPNFKTEELASLPVFGKTTFGTVTRPDGSETYVAFDELGSQVRKSLLNPAQKRMLVLLNEGEDMTGVELKALRDDLRDQVYDAKGKVRDGVSSQIKAMYKGLNDLLDDKVAEFAGPDVAARFNRDRKAFAMMMQQDALLRSKFGELVNVADVDEILDDVADPSAYAIREKMSQRLKTMSQNQDAWQAAATTLENVSGMPWRKYADLTRGMGIIEGVESAHGSKETWVQTLNEIRKGNQLTEQVLPKMVTNSYRTAKEMLAALGGIGQRTDPLEILQKSRLGGELPFYLKPYAEQGAGVLSTLAPVAYPAAVATGRERQ